jgi:single-strand DNA-binding protein
MQGLNKATLIGHLGKDPDMVTLEGGKNLAKFSLATSESYKDEAGQLHTQTDWHQIIVWGKLAEYAISYLGKGHLVYIEGKIKTRSFEDKDKQKRYVTEIVAEKLLHLEKKQKQAEENSPTQEELDADQNLPF